LPEGWYMMVYTYIYVHIQILYIISHVQSIWVFKTAKPVIPSHQKLLKVAAQFPSWMMIIAYIFDSIAV
jgi:hypothetical protein